MCLFVGVCFVACVCFIVFVLAFFLCADKGEKSEEKICRRGHCSVLTRRAEQNRTCTTSQSVRKDANPQYYCHRHSTGFTGWTATVEIFLVEVRDPEKSFWPASRASEACRLLLLFIIVFIDHDRLVIVVCMLLQYCDSFLPLNGLKLRYQLHFYFVCLIFVIRVRLSFYCISKATFSRRLQDFICIRNFLTPLFR